jgi:hypothetical protein
MVASLPQNSPKSDDDSDSGFHIDSILKLGYRYRVLLLVLSLVISSVLLFLEAPFGEYPIQTLSQKLAFGGQSPFLTIQQWGPDKRQLAQLELIVDTFFIFIYGFTLITWCSLFAHTSLFVVGNDGAKLDTPTARRMRQLGQKLALFVLVGMTADLIENTVLSTWLYIGISTIPEWLRWIWTIIVSLKFLPVIAAIWYILLHPLGILYSFIELWPTRKNAFSAKRDNLQNHAKSQQDYMITVQQQYKEAVEKENISHSKNANRRNSNKSSDSISSDRPGKPGDPSKPDGSQKSGGPNNPGGPPPSNDGPFRWLLTFWSSVLGVQFLLYLLLFMSIIINLDQFDEIFFLWLSSTNNLKIAGTISCFLLTLVGLSAMFYVTSKILLYLKPIKGLELANVLATNATTTQTTRTLMAHSGDFRFVQTLPLVFVALPFVITFFAFMKSYGDLPLNEQGASSHVFQFFLLITVLVLSGIITVYIFSKYHRPSEETDMLLFTSTTPTQDYALLVRLIPGSMLYGQGLLNILLLIFIPPTGLAVAQFFGLHAVLLLWLCVIAYLGTLLIQFNKLPLYPLILGVAVYTFIVSMFNDNSTIRQTPDSASTVSSRPTIPQYFSQWYKDRKNPTDSIPLPVIIIASEGGGIRAASWTTACLHQLDVLIPGFSHYVFGISGVSGGGVGAATYVALQRAKAVSFSDTLPLVGNEAQEVISQDLISPTTASMLFRGGIHNFSPGPIPSLDRNRWLEDAWENAAFSTISSHSDSVRNLLSQSFLKIWRDSSGRPQTYFPLVFLNSSVAETGQKAILSPVNLGNEPSLPQNAQNPVHPFYDVVDLFSTIQSDLPFKTATFLCARFPFVTSGGRVEGQLPNMKPTYQPAFHLIDGGYVENTGIMTSVQLIRSLQRLNSPPNSRYNVQYYLLFLRNGQASDNASSTTTFRFLSEPLTGFLNATGRQGLTLDQLVAYTLKKGINDPENELHFSYVNIALDRSTGHQYPLGWYLSPTAAKEMSTTAQKSIKKLIDKELKPIKDAISAQHR